MTSCVFCRIVKREAPASIVHEETHYLAFLDAHPQSRGHLQLIPKTHVRRIYDIPDMGEIFSLAQRIIRAIILVLGADHAVLGSFGNEVEHAHIWIVPQYGRGKMVTEGARVRESVGSYETLSKLLHDCIQKEVRG